MPRYTWQCNVCGYEEDHIVSYDNREKPIPCGKCAGPTKRQFPFEAVKGIRTFEPYYDESLGCDINDASEKRAVMSALGVHEAGDTVKGARNFEVKAPHKVGMSKLRGEKFQDRRFAKADDPIVEIERKDGTIDQCKFSELKSV